MSLKSKYNMLKMKKMKILLRISPKKPKIKGSSIISLKLIATNMKVIKRGNMIWRRKKKENLIP
eukprot:CAMPEP_0114584146 /NCGR_PEP_ID=MMETSP0125-20121206/7866_1 /TAXON_ID=485358 ORGANISM="Aristerostoma sp., Strain ATCC 50986" /NCGR_SAMPLE_ID=MMETSP0125 /ASSEMBLY_ACC=CAM_ASM_000245 /LENGTH=63 /DNA_ID=CAMNT_0001778285 /DNA_START=258 /DNA_END=449 /DNA_ORIENTATION=-